MERTSSRIGILLAGLLLALFAMAPGGGGDSFQVDGVERAKQAQEQHTDELLTIDGVVGTGVGLGADGQPVVVVFTATPGVRGIPARLDNVPVSVRVSGRFFARAPPPLNADFTYSCNGLSCDFDGSATKGRGSKTYAWDFGDGSTGSGLTASHTYGEVDNYPVTLTVNNDKGETDSETKVVSVSDDGDGTPTTTDCRAGGSATTTAACTRPVPIGVSIGHPDITAGTFGARVTDIAGNVFILTNNHIAANQNDASLGDAIIQPGAFDGGAAPDDTIGTLSAYEPMLFDGRDNTIDAAVVASSLVDLDNTTPDDGYGIPSSTRVAATLDMPVQKYGRTTGPTTGTVSEINVIVNVCYEGTVFCTKLARFVDQIAISPGDFSAGGDSGSLIVTNDASRNPVGLLFAGSSTRTLANRIDLVLNRFSVTVDGPARTPGGTTTGGAALSVTVTTDQDSYSNRDRVTITANVTDSTDPVSGASVNIAITTGNGNRLACNPTTNSSGDAVCTYRVNANRDGRGTYEITATATKSGYTSGTGSTTFEVT